MRVHSLLLLAALSTSPPPPVPPPTQQPSQAEAAERFEAVVRIGEPRGEHHPFLGVWLERSDGTRWVASYQTDALWRAFADRPVAVEGHRYAPEGQALVATHFRVTQLRLLKADPAAAYVSMGEERTAHGTLRRYTWPPGTKLAGEQALQFTADGGKVYALANPPTSPVLDQPLELRVREVEPSPFAARPGGPYLWIVGPGAP